MKIGIVNDLPMAVEVLRRIVLTVPGYEVIWIARDGEEAARFAAERRPDMILMDLIMPVMDGVEATRRIMTASPCAILVVTATVEGNREQVYEAMGHGALDAVCTPTVGTGGNFDGAQEFLHKMSLVARLIADPCDRSPEKIAPPRKETGAVAARELLLLGASTGGPQALSLILSQLPADFPAPVVLVQHVDARFAEGLATWLSHRSKLRVRTAPEGARLEQGTVWLAATNDHLVFSSEDTLHYTSKPEECAYRPSVDALFQSALKYWKGRGCAVLLTGMGRDGAAGLLSLRQAGFHTIAQDEKTSVVYGMPRAAAQLKAAQEILPVDQVAQSILRYFHSPKVA